MPGPVQFWHWWALGGVLIMIEMFAPGFMFLWIGVAAALAGGVLLAWPGLPLPGQAVVFAALSVASVAAWRWVQKVHPARSDEPNLNRRGAQYVGQRGRARAADRQRPGPDPARRQQLAGDRPGPARGRDRRGDRRRRHAATGPASGRGGCRPVASPARRRGVQTRAYPTLAPGTGSQLPLTGPATRLRSSPAAPVAELVDAANSKSVARKGVLVRVRPGAPGPQEQDFRR